jgi:hypothetical protein
MSEGSFGVLVDSVREENGVKCVSYYCRISIRRWLEEPGGFENSVVSSSVGMPTKVSVFEDLPLQMWCVGWSYKLILAALNLFCSQDPATLHSCRYHLLFVAQPLSCAIFR